MPKAPRTGTTIPKNESASPKQTPLPELVGDTRDAWAFASLHDPHKVTVEGRVSSSQAWSTSKVLIVAAYLDSALDGDPHRLTSSDQRLVVRALSRSDADAVQTIRNKIPGSPGAAMNAVLRDIGDTSTMAPDHYQGLMSWSIREQVRFMAALAAGEVVSHPVSAYLLHVMRPIRQHAWGLGSIGATSYKGGWLRQDTVTRQMGIVDSYAVAIITDGVGPAVRQTDGDYAHVAQMNKLARKLEKRLAYERTKR